MLREQLESIFSDFKIDGIKIGMVYNSKIIKVIHQKLKKLKIPIVVDPVIRSTTGGSLIENSAKKDFQKYIIPLATIIHTKQNRSRNTCKNENFNKKNTPEKVAKEIQNMGAKNVIITGIEEKNNIVSDFVLEKKSKYIISGGKISKVNHGSGCTHSKTLQYIHLQKEEYQRITKFCKEIYIQFNKKCKKNRKGIVITDIQSKKWS